MLRSKRDTHRLLYRMLGKYMIVHLPAQLLKVESRSDRTYKLTFNTRELRGSEASVLLNEIMNEGWLLYSSTSEIDEQDIPKEKADSGMGTKTPSQRLRACLYVMWEQQGKKGSFEDYYRVQMEKVIDYIKDKLEG